VSAAPSLSAPGGAVGPCDTNPRVTVSVVGGPVDGASLHFQLVSTHTGEPVCADVNVYVSWVSYYYLDDGRQAMHGGAGFEVPRMTRDWTPTIEVDMGCRGDLYVMARTSDFSVLPAGVHHPVPIASAADGWKGEIASFINEPAICTPAGQGGTSYPVPGAPPPPPPPPPTTP
jgi:hypothetical protein